MKITGSCTLDGERGGDGAAALEWGLVNACSGSGTCMLAALDAGASWVHGVDINMLCLQVSQSGRMYVYVCVVLYVCLYVCNASHTNTCI